MELEINVKNDPDFVETEKLIRVKLVLTVLKMSESVLLFVATEMLSLLKIVKIVLKTSLFARLTAVMGN